MQRTFAVQSCPEGTDRPLRIVLVGLGPIGRSVADECGRRGKDVIEVVGAVDSDPKLVGKTLGDHWGPGRHDAGVAIVATPADLAEAADVAVVTTTSRLDTLQAQLEPLFARGLSVVSSAEELFYPWLSDEPQALRIDGLAKRYGVSVTGAGINPGFLMDVLPTALAVASGPPYRVRCERYVDLARRRIPLQVKAGLGMEADHFGRRADALEIGHVGLVESAAYVAGHLGIAISAITESLEPVLATEAFDWQGRTYPEGRVVGFVHQARGWGEGADPACAPVELFLRMTLHEADARDRIILTGTPDIDLTIRPCVLGDPATAAVLVHLAARCGGAAPGLRLPHELGLVPQGPRYRISRL